MPNQRADNRILVGVWLTPEFIAAMDGARQMEHADRSTFIRRAIAEELRRRGIKVDVLGIHAPDRTRKRGTYPIMSDQASALNEASSTKDPVALANAAAGAVMKNAKQRPARKREADGQSGKAVGQQ